MTSLGNRHSQHSFSQVPQANMARSKFDRSFAAKDTYNFDYLTPCFVDEVLPGDTINLNLKTFQRLATQAVPVMDNMYVDFFFFFVPNRLVWENWERFNGAQDDPGDSTDFLVPRLDVSNGTSLGVGSIYDHMGLPTQNLGSPAPRISALPFRAYNLIWNEWFRDQNLQDRIPVPKGDGPDSVDPSTNYVLRKRAKKHDYFTSALPWPQKGPAIGLPIGGFAPVVSDGMPINLRFNQTLSGWNTRYIYGPGTNELTMAGPAITDNPAMYALRPEDFTDDKTSGMQVSLADATATSINQFRQAIMMQSLLELDARGGTRYTEILKAHFNVTNPDFRLQRPEFLSSGTVQISQHPVAQTSETGSSPQANLAAYSTASSMGNNIGFSKSFTEHGYVIGLMQARADVTYQQGINRMWSRATRWDYFWPKLQETGEQTVLNQEIFVPGVISADPEENSPNDGVFGYQERYAEYRYRPSEIKGQFRSDYAESLDVWHLAQEFATNPKLNADFIQSNTPIERVLVVTDPSYPNLLADFWYDYKHARPIMTYGVPATLGRF